MINIKLLIIALLVMSVSAFAQTDPTRPLTASGFKASTPEEKKNDLVLQSIIKTAADNQLKAIVSGRIVKQGDQVFGYRVTKIDGRSVTLQSADSARKLTLFAKNIVKYK